MHDGPEPAPLCHTPGHKRRGERARSYDGLHEAALGTGNACQAREEAASLAAFSISFRRKKFSAVRRTMMAASWPISFHVGATAVRRMSAASSNSSAKASQRPSSRRTTSWPASGARDSVRPGRRTAAQKQEQRAHYGFRRGNGDHERRSRLDAVRQVECQLLEQRFNHELGRAAERLRPEGSPLIR